MIAFSPILSAPDGASPRRCFAPPPLSPRSRSTVRPFNVVIVYDDIAAGERAVRTLDRVRMESAPSTQFAPIPWSFNFLADLPWRSKAIRDVDSADLIILSISRPDEVPSAINHWITTCLHRELVACIPVIVQFEGDDTWTLTPQIIAAAAATRESVPVVSSPVRIAPDTRSGERFPFARLSARHPAFSY